MNADLPTMLDRAVRVVGFGILLSIVTVFCGPTLAERPTVGCGDVITADVALKADVGPCTGDGLIVGASGITINLNGHRVHATRRTHIGIRIQDANNVTVKGGVVEGFSAGILVIGGLNNEVSTMTLQNNRFGVLLEHAASGGHRIHRNLATRNRLAGIFLRSQVSNTTVSRNRVIGNAGYGILVADGSQFNLITGNEASDNGNADINLRDTSWNVRSIAHQSPAFLDLVSPDRLPYVEGVDYQVTSVAIGDVVGRLVPVGISLAVTATKLDNPNPADTSESGCRQGDFEGAGFVPGDIALLQRGTCALDVKLNHARTAGARAVIIFNEGQSPTRVGFDFGLFAAFGAADMPVLSTTYATGYDLYRQSLMTPTIVRVRSDVSLGPGGTVVVTTDVGSNLITRNVAGTAVDEYFGPCGENSNQWSRNEIERYSDFCFIPPGGGGIGATTDAY